MKAAKVFFYNTVVAQAYRVDVTPAKVTFVFLPNQRVPKHQCEDARPWLESLAEKVFGRRVPVAVIVSAAAAAPAATVGPTVDDRKRASDEELRKEALTDPGVQALFEIFPVEKSKVEEI